MRKKVIGLIGGMGPYASVYFYKLLLDKAARNFGAKNNNDFPEIVLNSVPAPDFISDSKSLSKVRKMLTGRTKDLVRSAGVVALVCNTGHILASDLHKASGGRFVSMVDLVAKEAKKRGYSRVGVLTTPTARKLGLYKKALSDYGIEVVPPGKKAEKIHEEIIREVIAGGADAGHSRTLYRLATDFVRKNNLDGLILGCTELPLVFPKNRFKNVIDCMDVLADELLIRYYGR